MPTDILPEAYQFIQSFFVIGTILLALIVVFLIVIVVVIILTQGRSKRTSEDVEASIAARINELVLAAQHHADVSSVVEMVRQLDELDEDAVALLATYPENVRAAAWLHYINTLGADLQAAQLDLSNAHQGTGIYRHYSDRKPFVREAQEHVNQIRAKLDEAIERSGQGGIRAV